MYQQQMQGVTQPDQFMEEEKVREDSPVSRLQIWVLSWEAQWPLGKARSKDRQEIGSGLSPSLYKKSQGAEAAQRELWFILTATEPYPGRAGQGNSQESLAQELEMLSTPCAAGWSLGLTELQRCHRQSRS